MTTSEIKNIPVNKIVTINKKVGTFSQSMQLKIFKSNFMRGKDDYAIVVVTREGLLNYSGNAQEALFCGKKGVDYSEFASPTKASKYIENYLTSNN